MKNIKEKIFSWFFVVFLLFTSVMDSLESVFHHGGHDEHTHHHEHGSESNEHEHEHEHEEANEKEYFLDQKSIQKEESLDVPTGLLYTNQTYELNENSSGDFYLYAENIECIGLEIEIYYDSTYFSVIDGPVNNVYLDNPDTDLFTCDYSKAGEIKITYLFFENKILEGNILSFSLMSKEVNETTKSYVDVCVGNAFNQNYELVSISAEGCYVTIKDVSLGARWISAYGSVDKIEIFEEDTFIYSIGLSDGNSSVVCGEFILEYNKDLLSYIDLSFDSTIEGILFDVNSDVKGVLFISFVSRVEISSSYNFIDITFQAINKENAETSILTTCANFYNKDYVDVSCNSINTSIELLDRDVFDASPTMYLNNVDVDAAKEFKIYISIGKNTNLAAGDFYLKFNSNYFDCISYELNTSDNLYMGINLNQLDKGLIQLSVLSPKPLIEKMELCVITFKGYNMYMNANSTMQIYGKNVYDGSFQPINFNYENAQVIVRGHSVHEYGQWIIGQSASCLYDGYKYRLCIYCGYREKVTIPANGEHTYMKTVYEPTCTSYGYTSYLCTVCGSSYEADFLDPIGHDYSYSSYIEKDPTCYDGGTLVRECSCGDRSYEYLEPLGHDFNTTVIDPSCTNSGYTIYTCIRCAYSYNDNYTASIDHELSNELIVTQEPDCTSSGYGYYYCLRCDYTQGVYIPETGHLNYHWEERYSATCTSDGLEACVCDDCGCEINWMAIPALGHDYKIIIIDPTCTTDGYVLYECQRCFESYKDGYSDMYGHSYGEWIIEYEPDDCEGTGKKYCICQWCGHKLEEYFYGGGHKYTTRVVNPTCTEEGYTLYECETCGYSYKDNFVPCIEHKFIITVHEGTCLDQGYIVTECETCDYYTVDYTTYGNHDYEKTIIPSTCYSQGYTIYRCKTCGDTYISDYTQTSEHINCSWITTLEPTCTENGTEELICNDCGTVLDSRVIESKGHEYEDEIIKSTCTTQGYTIHVCKHCGFTYWDAYTPAAGHSYGNWIIDNDPTCTTSGSKYRTCNICGHKETAKIPAPGHNYESIVVDPTCTTEGYTLHTCTRCGNSYKDNYTDITDHKYGDWIIDSNPTCTESGSKHKECSCGHTITETIQARGHDEGSWIVEEESTCTKEGVEHLVCGECGEVLDTRKIAAKPHSFEEIVVDPTCTEHGYTEHVCKECGHSYKDNYTNPTGHTYGDWIIDSEATCTQTGSRHRKCNNCEHTKTEVIQVLGHNYESTVINSTCTEQGYTLHTCTLCGDTYKDNYTNIKEHDFGDWIIDVEPTYEADGLKHMTCKDCGYTIEQVIPQLNHNFITIVVDPTCTEEGYTLYKCTDCDYSYKDNFVPKLDHTYGDWIIDRNPTCTENGLKHKTCSCGHTVYETIAATGHDEGSWIVVEDSTCTKEGTENLVCQKCGAVLDSRKIAAKPHSFEETVVDPTCTTQGYTLHKCKDCGYSYKDNYKDVIKHSYGDWIIDKDSTCTENGSKHKTCSCGHTITETIKATGHDDGSWVVVKDSTCTEEGLENLVCNKCGKVLNSRVIAKKGHTYIDTVVNPTCTTQGYTEHVCKECGYSYKDSYVNSTGHTYGDWIIDSEATCTQTGSRHRKCNNCEHTETEVIQVLGHNYETQIINPTCTEKGYTLHTCTRCGDSYKDNYTDIIEHLYGDWIVDKDSTCTENGSKHKTCSCGHTITETIKATGHDEGVWITVEDSTCTKEGVEHLVCEECGEVLDTRKIAAKPHSFEEIVVDPSCTQQGYTLHKCKDCGYSYKDNYKDVVEHSYGDWIVDKDPTCTENGSKHKTCSCGHTITETIKATGHDDGSWVVVKDSTCIEEGLENLVCNKCGKVLNSRVIAKKGHTYIDTVVNPTCTTQGYTEHVCKDCGYSYKDNYVNSTGHTYGDWIIDKEATCTESGSKHKECNCGHIVRETISPTEHDEGSWIVIEESTCTKEGTENLVCSKCGIILDTRKMSIKNHNYIDTVVDPTCTEKGYTEHVCKDCGHSYRDNYKDAKGHTYGDWIIDKEATCVESGSRHKTCSCGHTVTETINPKGHGEGKWVVIEDSTCTKEGTENLVCKDCGEVLNTRKIPVKPHSFEEHIVNPTCTEQGYTEHVCKDCGYSYKDNYTDPKDHTYGDWIIDKEATCTEDGLKHKECSCGHAITQVINAKGHGEGTWVTVEESTCTKEGTENLVCEDCGAVLDTRKIAAKPHSFVDTVVDPTCTERGYTLHRCKDCGYSYEDSYVDAKGHTYGDWIIEEEATCTEDGTMKRECSCGHSETISYSKGKHTHTVTFIVDGDTYVTIEVVCGEEVELPIPPTKENNDGYSYQFNGWDGYSDGMKIYGDTTFIASFTSTKLPEDNLPIIIGASAAGAAVVVGTSIGLSIFFKKRKFKRK